MKDFINLPSTSQIVERLRDLGIDDTLCQRISKRLDTALGYEPLVGIFGKTGAGKSSLCNALFGRHICTISDVEACTRNVQEVFLQSRGNGITLLDVPGVGESRDRDTEYSNLYRQLLPNLDLVLWLIKADDRALRSDEEFYKAIVRPHLQQGKPFFVVLSQVDRIDPFREWDTVLHRPGTQQMDNIERKRHAVAGFLDIPLDHVLAVSAAESYGLVDLVDKIVHALPKQRRVTFVREVARQNVSERAVRSARQGFLDYALETVEDVIGGVLETASSIVRSVGGFFRGLFG
ncbi:GTPase family protein [Acidithiobacillus caldus]